MQSNRTTLHGVYRNILIDFDIFCIVIGKVKMYHEANSLINRNYVEVKYEKILLKFFA